MGFILKDDEYPPRKVIGEVLGELMDLIGHADSRELDVICSIQAVYNKRRLVNFSQLNYLKVIRTRLRIREQKWILKQ